MTINSLAFRLSATAAAWNLLVLPIAGAIIYSLYRQEVVTSFDRRISLALTVVLSDTIDHGGGERGVVRRRRRRLPLARGVGRSYPIDRGDGERGAPKDAGEPLFEVTHSGWY